MPTSLIELIQPVVHIVWTYTQRAGRPLRILDVGPGYGKYGVLIREYVGNPERFDAVEAWSAYVNRRLLALYDHVFLGDVCTLDESALANYDLVLMIDVIEHIDKHRAQGLLNRIPGEIVISTPQHFFDNPVDLPPTERHLSHWTMEDFGSRVVADYSRHGALLVVLGSYSSGEPDQRA